MTSRGKNITVCLWFGSSKELKLTKINFFMGVDSKLSICFLSNQILYAG